MTLWCLSGSLCPRPRGTLQPPRGAGGRDELALGQAGFPEAAAQAPCGRGFRLADPSSCSSVSPASVASTSHLTM